MIDRMTQDRRKNDANPTAALWAWGVVRHSPPLGGGMTHKPALVGRLWALNEPILRQSCVIPSVGIDAENDARMTQQEGHSHGL